MTYADLREKQFQWRERVFGPLDRLPLWVGYLFGMLCSVGLGYTLGSARLNLPDPRRDQITLFAVIAAGAFLFIFLLDLTRRSEERRRAERAEQLRVSKEVAGS